MTKKYKTLIVGFGKVANSFSKDLNMSKYIKYQSHAQVLKNHPKLDWMGVIDPNILAQQSATKDWKIKLVLGNTDDFFDYSVVEILVISTPANLRFDVLKKFLNLKGLIIEKPLALTDVERNKIISFCNEFKIKVNVNYLRRLDDLTIKFSKEDFAKKVGDIQFGSILYGNGIRNNGSHFIDQIRMLGAKINFVQALNKPLVINKKNSFSDYNLNVLLGLKNGAQIIMHSLNFDYYREQVTDLWGTKGKIQIYQEGIFFKLNKLNSHRALDDNIEISLDNDFITKSSIGEAFYKLYDDLIEAIEKNIKTKSDLLNAKITEEIIDNILKSAHNNNVRINL